MCLFSRNEWNWCLVPSATDGVRRSQKYLDTFMGFAESRKKHQIHTTLSSDLEKKAELSFFKDLIYGGTIKTALHSENKHVPRARQRAEAVLLARLEPVRSMKQTHIIIIPAGLFLFGVCWMRTLCLRLTVMSPLHCDNQTWSISAFLRKTLDCIPMKAELKLC